MPLRGRPILKPGINKPVYRRLDRNRFEGLPGAPPRRIISEAVLAEARARKYCEWCGVPYEHVVPSHAESRGAGGDDTRLNVTSSCVFCHNHHHAGGEPTTPQLLTVARLREDSRRPDGTHDRIVGRHQRIDREGNLEDRPMLLASLPPGTDARPGDWLIVLRPAPEDPHVGRRLAKVLKHLLRIGGIKCIDARTFPEPQSKP
jgi:hypothetical protein